MSQLKIVQKDGITHTIFMVLDEGRAFPESNYEIAKGWQEAGLLDEHSEMLMRLIQETMDNKKEEIDHAGKLQNV